MTNKVTKLKFSSTEAYTLDEIETQKLWDKLRGRTYTLVEE